MDVENRDKNNGIFDARYESYSETCNCHLVTAEKIPGIHLLHHI
ncbi:Uncharacterised protein [Grimontia hollisae]|nr:Uncharacterised protein [Grimontia hollisae]